MALLKTIFVSIYSYDLTKTCIFLKLYKSLDGKCRSHYQPESQTMNTTACLILITATLLAAAKGTPVDWFEDNVFYYEMPAPTNKVILVSCLRENEEAPTVEQLNISSEQDESKQLGWSLRMATSNPATGCTAMESNVPVSDRIKYHWTKLTLPFEKSLEGQDIIVVTPPKFKEGGIVWVGSK